MELRHSGAVVAFVTIASIAAGLVLDDIESHIEAKFRDKAPEKERPMNILPPPRVPFRAALRSRRTPPSIATCALLCFAFLPEAFAQITRPDPAVVTANTDQYGYATVTISYNFPDTTDDGGLQRLIIISVPDLAIYNEFHYMSSISGTTTWGHDLLCRPAGASYVVIVSPVRVLPTTGQYVGATSDTRTTMSAVPNNATVSLSAGGPDDTGHLDVSVPFSFTGVTIHNRNLVLWVDEHFPPIQAPDSVLAQDSGTWLVPIETACMKQGSQPSALWSRDALRRSRPARSTSTTSRRYAPWLRRPSAPAGSRDTT